MYPRHPRHRRAAVLLPALAGAALALVAVLPAPIAAHAAASFPVTITQGTRTVRIARKPVRIVSLSPTATEMLFAIGAGPQVKAVDDQSTYPPKAPRTALSGFTPNIEAIAAYRPDLVVISADGKHAEALRALKIPVLVQGAATNLDGTYAEITELGKATGRTRSAASLVSSMRSRIAKTIATTPKGRYTYYHELDNTLYSVTSKTFIGDLYALLGLTNVADPADKDGVGYPQLSAEFLLSADPDFIFLADTKCCGQSAAEVAKRPGWDQLTAVKNGRVIALDDDVASRWGPRVPDFLAAIATAVRASALDQAA